MRGRRCASREAGGPGVWWRHTRGMHWDVARFKAWGPRARAERTVNMANMVVTLEVSKLSGWLKADADCRVEGRACDAGGRGVRAGRREGLGCGGGTTSGMHGEDGPAQGLGATRARAERTANMAPMVVTLEVSQPEMSALKFVNLRKSWPMSVMAETSQSAMGPHVAVAAVGLALNSWTLVCREALVVKTQGGADGDGGGGGEDGPLVQLPGAQPEP
jgi:hypothetical protein